MVAPSGNQQRFQVLLEFATNEEVFNRIEEQTKGIANQSKRAEEMTRLYGEALKKLYPELYKEIEAEKAAAEAAEKHRAAVEKQSKELALSIRNLRAQSREIIAQARLIRDSAEDWDRLFTPLTRGGLLVTGSFFALATKYVNDAEQATAATRGWKAAQEDLEQSGARIGEVLAREALPLLQDVAKVTRQVASTLEAHPEIARAVLAGGLVALAAGTLGNLYTKGLRLYADIKLDKSLALQMTAAELQLQASNNQLKAAGLQSQGSIKGAASTGVGGLAAGLASPLGSITLLAGAVVAANALDEKLIHLEKSLAATSAAGAALAKGLDLVTRTAFNFIAPMLPIVHTFKDLKDSITDLFGGAKKAQQEAASSSTVGNFLGGSKEIQDKIVNAFADWKKDDARIVQDAMQARKQIIADGERSIVDLTRNYVNQRNSISAQFNAEAASLTNRFIEDNKKADADYARERSEIVRDSNETIRDLEEDHQKNLEKMERDSLDRQREFAANRDALGLVLEQERLERQKAEAEQTTNEAIAKERQETAQRLQELSSRYAQERAQRQAQYQEDMKENALRRAQALKEAQDRYLAEKKQLQEANAQKLKDLDAASQQERTRRREQLVAQLHDLDEGFVAERTLRKNEYNAILQEAALFMNSYKQTLALSLASAASIGVASGGVAGTSTTTGGINNNFPGQYHDFTGYADRGIYRMAWNGGREFVLDQSATRAAERAIGGQLSENAFSQMFAMMAALRGSATLVDRSTYGKDMTVRQIRDIKEVQAKQLDKMLGGY